MSKADIAALLERVRAASGPDWEIDAALAAMLGWSRLAPPADYDRPMPSLWVDPEGRICGSMPPHWTGSLNSITDLIQLQLPGQIWRVEPEYDLVPSLGKLSFFASINDWEKLRDNPGDIYVHHIETARAATAALALLCCFLAAKLSLSDHSQT